MQTCARINSFAAALIVVSELGLHSLFKTNEQKSKVIRFIAVNMYILVHCLDPTLTKNLSVINKSIKTLF